MKRLSPIMLVALLLLLCSCVSQVKLNVRHAPELNLPGVRSLSVEPFVANGNLHLDAGTFGKGFVGAVASAAVGMVNNKLAEEKVPSLVNAQQFGLKDALVRDGFFQVKESGSADARLGGSFQYEVRDNVGEQESKDGSGKIVRTYTLTRKGTVMVSFSVTAADGTLLGSSQVAGSVEKKSTGSTKDETRVNAVAWEQVVQEALAQTYPLLVKKIAPYFVSETRTLEKGEGEGVKAGNAAAEKGDWPTALTHWNAALVGGSAADRVAATCNLAIYDEVEGRLAEALKKYEELSRNGGDKYVKEAGRIRARIAEEEKLRAVATGR